MTPAPALPPLPPMLRPQQVAELLGVSSQTVRRYCADGRLPHRRLSPRIVRIPRDAVVQLLTGGAS